MKLLIKRCFFLPDYTIGKYYIDYERNFGYEYFCDTLEPTVRAPGIKIDGKTAIPEGNYKMSIVHSPANKMDVPLLQNVPGFTAIEQHIGNFPHDTHGCTLIGQNKIKGQLINSTITFLKLMDILKKSGQKEWEIIYTH
jgi:hypothetical protein